MKLFTRRVLMAGPPAETMQYATDMCEFVTGKVGREVALWSAQFGAPLGSMMYSTRVEGIADLQSATAALLADPEYHAKIAAGAGYVAAPSEDQLATPILGELGNESPPVGSFAGVTSAQIANGKYADAFAWAVEIAEHVASVTGVPEMVLTGDYGPFGTLTWVAVTADAAGIDAMMEKMAGDEGYLKMLGAAGELFVPGSGQQALITRVA